MNLTEFIKKDNIKNFFKEEFHKPEIVHTGTCIPIFFLASSTINNPNSIIFF
ncbi:hypothetical protein LCGC14_1191160 [marine sediment metagenome]|uniref:Uncharacterized protein n=1 Tax=marine sediment metagenome TaxID=412755 RepID=A0A0F9PPN6_9ZZZZ